MLLSITKLLDCRFWSRKRLWQDFYR